MTKSEAKVVIKNYFKHTNDDLYFDLLFAIIKANPYYGKFVDKQNILEDLLEEIDEVLQDIITKS